MTKYRVKKVIIIYKDITHNQNLENVIVFDGNIKEITIKSEHEF